MLQNEIDERIVSLIGDVLELKDSTRLRTTPRDKITEWDSLGHLRIFMAIENKYNIKIQFEEMLSSESLEDIVNLVKQKFSKHSSDN